MLEIERIVRVEELDKIENGKGDIFEVDEWAKAGDRLVRIWAITVAPQGYANVWVQNFEPGLCKSCLEGDGGSATNQYNLEKIRQPVMSFCSECGEEGPDFGPEANKGDCNAVTKRHIEERG